MLTALLSCKFTNKLSGDGRKTSRKKKKTLKDTFYKQSISENIQQFILQI